MEDTKKVWAVISNTDKTEGRGRQYIICLCDMYATALRKSHKAGVQGMDADVISVELLRHKNTWYGPVTIEEPTSEDIKHQHSIDIKEKAVEKAKSLGLTDEDITILRL